MTHRLAGLTGGARTVTLSLGFAFPAEPATFSAGGTCFEAVSGFSFIYSLGVDPSDFPNLVRFRLLTWVSPIPSVKYFAGNGGGWVGFPCRQESVL